ncbi:hypothetical protein OFL75_18715 [Pseudomonas aeruginosa]|uniref:hypothetical protein n=1 Tax=Pseudomonas TaxID=286 RepID=UPI0002CA046C|nr:MULTISPECIES: hypothetical protein [Pseudomonas]EMZ44862.1 hypothetical protein HMPREF1224_11664 [Pseudomonas sp. P179]MCV6110452.1 hypothetical protein [Pseudomonas aeruginosa]MCV6116576.1 hypothetical protein [Pseudomonas aeruginosa]MCV6124080.1 hypothetical protein [Pseudomonas aeruginosa]MCV6149415.1 hypothetical protein [Pseudomonas aeruginosa]
MVDRKALHLIARNPRLHAQYVRTGRVPEFKKPESPLITLLESINPRDRLAITAVVIGPALGYSGRRCFQNAAQALNWLKPQYTAASYPSESWRIKRFAQRLGIEDLAECAQVPEGIIKEWNRRHHPGR